MFDNTSDTKLLRLAATNSGCTMATRTASNSAAMLLACAADCPACDAAALSHPAYGAAAAAIALAAAPCHEPLTKPDVTVSKDAAADANSSAKPSQAAAAASIGSDPAPENINAELISGGSTKKLMVRPLRWHRCCWHHANDGRHNRPGPEPAVAAKRIS